MTDTKEAVRRALAAYEAVDNRPQAEALAEAVRSMLTEPEPRVIPEVDGLLTCPDCGSHEFKENGSHPCDWAFGSQDTRSTEVVDALWLKVGSVVIGADGAHWPVTERSDGPDGGILVTVRSHAGTVVRASFRPADPVTVAAPKKLVLAGGFEWYDGDGNEFECLGCGAHFDDLAEGWVSDYT